MKITPKPHQNNPKLHHRKPLRPPHNAVPRLGLEPGPLDPESGELTIRSYAWTPELV